MTASTRSGAARAEAYDRRPTPPGHLARSGSQRHARSWLPSEGMASVSTYNVRAKRWARGWELHVDGVGVTQAHRLASAEEMARSYIAMMRDVSPESIKVNIIPEIDGELGKAATDARRMVKQAEQAQLSAAAQSRAVAHQLRENGLSGRDIAAVLQLSPQRVSQLLRPSLKTERTGQKGGTGRSADSRSTIPKTARSGIAVKSSARSTSAVRSMVAGSISKVKSGPGSSSASGKRSSRKVSG